MITKPSSAFKALLGGVLFASFLIISCNDEKKAEEKTEPAKTETPAETPKDTTKVDSTGQNHPVVPPPPPSN